MRKVERARVRRETEALSRYAWWETLVLEEVPGSDVKLGSIEWTYTENIAANDCDGGREE